MHAIGHTYWPTGCTADIFNCALSLLLCHARSLWTGRALIAFSSLPNALTNNSLQHLTTYARMWLSRSFLTRCDLFAPTVATAPKPPS